LGERASLRQRERREYILAQFSSEREREKISERERRERRERREFRQRQEVWRNAVYPDDLYYYATVDSVEQRQPLLHVC
jgi:hypothetical protein